MVSMTNKPSADRDYILWTLLRQTADAAARARDKELMKRGLTASGADALFAIKAIGDEATPAHISRWMFRQSHSVSGLLDRLERSGHIKRTKDLARKNMVRISLTKKGEEAFRACSPMEAIHSVMSTLSDERREQLARALELVRDKALDELRMAKPTFPQ